MKTRHKHSSYRRCNAPEPHIFSIIARKSRQCWQALNTLRWTNHRCQRSHFAVEFFPEHNVIFVFPNSHKDSRDANSYRFDSNGSQWLPRFTPRRRSIIKAPNKATIPRAALHSPSAAVRWRGARAGLARGNAMHYPPWWCVICDSVAAHTMVKKRFYGPERLAIERGAEGSLALRYKEIVKNVTEIFLCVAIYQVIGLRLLALRFNSWLVNLNLYRSWWTKEYHKLELWWQNIKQRFNDGFAQR